MTVRPQIRPAAEKHSVSRQQGFAIIVVLLVIVILMLLGTSFLLMADTENRIAENERVSDQALYAAETGTRMVKRWFDRPMSASNLANPTLAVIDRTLRLIDADGDPATAAIAADGTVTKPYYKQGVDLNGDTVDDVFEDPYRGSLEDTFLGTEAGPDIRIDETASVATKAMLANMSDALFSNYPGRGIKARIILIDIYAPPYAPVGGTWTRYGLATVKVIARIYQDTPGGERTLADRMVKIVINEIPYNLDGALGPLHSCDNLAWNGEFSVHWGVATAVGDADLHNNHDKAAVSLPRSVDSGVGIDLLWAYSAADTLEFLAYKTIIDGLRIDDPWLRFFAGGDLAEAAPSTQIQPFPFTWTAGNLLADGDLPYHPGPPGPHPYPVSWDGTHSNLFQRKPGVGCPEFDYTLWKSIAREGGPNVHYYEFDPVSSGFKEDGKGVARTFRQITDQQTGFFFFDTVDGVEPTDTDADGIYDNLTPSIAINGGRWGTRGMIYLNALTFQSTGVNGRTATFKAPGEPFQDVNQNGDWDTGEEWINVDYPTSLGGLFVADSTDNLQDDGTTTGAAVRNTWGPDVNDDALMWGILYNSGFYDATGNGTYYGSLVSKLGIGWFSPSAGTPHHYWDASIKDNWPPDNWLLPRVAITRWETDM